MTTAAGVWFYSVATRRYLYLLRADKRTHNTWGLPGGKAHPGESLLNLVTRECTEELGLMPDYKKLVPIERFVSKDNAFDFHTLFCAVPNEFQPFLNHEHLGYAWLDRNVWPKPMHPGLWNTVNFQEIINKLATLEQQIHAS